MADAPHSHVPERIRCPACDHWLTSTGGGPCPECGVSLSPSVAAPEPSAAILPFLLVALALSSSTGLRRGALYAMRWSELVDGRLTSTPWPYLLLEASLLLAPILLVAALLRQRSIRAMPKRVVMLGATLGALPFLLDIATLLRS